jgi:hypothetical protein
MRADPKKEFEGVVDRITAEDDNENCVDADDDEDE